MLGASGGWAMLTLWIPIEVFWPVGAGLEREVCGQCDNLDLPNCIEILV